MNRACRCTLISPSPSRFRPDLSTSVIGDDGSDVRSEVQGNRT